MAATIQHRRDDAWANIDGAGAVHIDQVTWYRTNFDVTADSDSEGIMVGANKAVHIHLGTVNTNVATSAATIEVQALNPDGTWNDTGDQISIPTGASPAVDVYTIFDCPAVIRFDLTSSPTAGDFNLLVEVQR